MQAMRKIKTLSAQTWPAADGPTPWRCELLVGTGSLCVIGGLGLALDAVGVSGTTAALALDLAALEALANAAEAVKMGLDAWAMGAEAATVGLDAELTDLGEGTSTESAADSSIMGAGGGFWTITATSVAPPAGLSGTE